MKVMLSYISHFVSGLLVLAVCMFSGCRKSVVPEEHETGDYISFGGKAAGDYDVKSGDGTTSKLVTTELLKKEPFGIFGYKSFDDKTGFTNVFSTDKAQKVSWDKTLNDNKGAWKYEPKQKWVRSMHYRFRAVWPYKPENIQAGSSANCFSVTYSSFVEDYDLMVAYATRWPLQDGVDPVPLSFKHALAGLRFKIKFAEDITESDNLTEFYITGIYPHGQLFYGFGLNASVTKDGEGGTETGSTKVDDGLIVWKCGDNAFNSTTPQFHWQSTQTDEEPKPFGGKSQAANVYFTENPAGVDGAALIVPQILSSEPGMETYVNFYTVNGGSALHRAELPKIELKPGNIYTFTLTINRPQITIKVDIQDWKAINSNIDIIL